MPEDASERPSLGRCGSYELLVELASGGMATVYLARAADGRDAPLVAIKRPHRHLAKDKTYLSMLVDEARLASAIRHDHVVRVRELGFQSIEPFVVMDYVEGASLSDVRSELSALGRAIDPRLAVRIALDALAGLEAAHTLSDDAGRHLGIVHRDVSPHNVLIGCDGLARLTDFGIAKARDRVQVTQTHEVKGKLAYLAPERIDKRRICTAQSDVFSMAVVLWECIAGRRLFRGEEALETLQEVISAHIPSLRKLGSPVSEALDTVIARGLQRDLDERFKTAAEFAAALEAAAGRPGIAAPAEVATLIETLFGERLRVRHESIRQALDGRDPDPERVLEISGLHPRPPPTPEMREKARRQLESIAPPAPSARYAFGSPTGGRRFGTTSLRLALAGASGLLLLGILSVIFVMTRRTDAPATPAASHDGELRSRRVVVALPFVAKRVTFDDESRELSPPVDVVAFDVPREGGVRHRVTAVSVDGARAEGFVREADGVAKVEAPGFAIAAVLASDEGAPPVIELPEPRASKRTWIRPRAGTPRTAKDAGSPMASVSAKPVGTVKDGFTKLP